MTRTSRRHFSGSHHYSLPTLFNSTGNRLRGEATLATAGTCGNGHLYNGLWGISCGLTRHVQTGPRAIAFAGDPEDDGTDRGELAIADDLVLGDLEEAIQDRQEAVGGACLGPDADARKDNRDHLIV